MQDTFDWNDVKNNQLKDRHGFGFERIGVAISEGGFLNEREHPNVQKYGHQLQLVIRIDGYAWLVPFVRDGDRRFLKTMFPSRDATKQYLGKLQ